MEVQTLASHPAASILLDRLQIFESTSSVQQETIDSDELKQKTNYPLCAIRPALDLWCDMLELPGSGWPIRDDTCGTHSFGDVDLISKYPKGVSGELVLAALSGGLLGLAPATIAEGDILVYVPNVFPFMILRPKSDVYEFRGLAHVHGVMDPEFWEGLDMSAMPNETFVIAQVSVVFEYDAVFFLALYQPDCHNGLQRNLVRLMHYRVVQFWTIQDL
jgi:hypothetical protein